MSASLRSIVVILYERRKKKRQKRERSVLVKPWLNRLKERVVGNTPSLAPQSRQMGEVTFHRLVCIPRSSI